MKNLFLLSFIFLSLIQEVKAQNWNYDFDNAKKIAIATNKIMVVDFFASWCGPCKKMDASVWSNPDIKKLLNQFVPVKIDIDIYKKIKNHYDIKRIPQIFILDPNGEIINSKLGYQSIVSVKSLLNKYSNLNLQYIQNELLNFYKNPNYSNALRIANKYQIISILLKKPIKNEFLNLSDSYFRYAKKEIQKRKDKSKINLLQKIHLLRIRKKAILNKPKQTLKKIAKISKIDPSNESLFSFLNYISYMQLNQINNANKWKKTMNENDKKLVNMILTKKEK